MLKEVSTESTAYPQSAQGSLSADSNKEDAEIKIQVQRFIRKLIPENTGGGEDGADRKEKDQ